MNLTCATCGKPITELPFQPSADRPVYCKDHIQRNERRASPRERGPRQLFDVSSMNLTCATCGKPITELPFQPSPDRPVYCREDSMKRRQSFSGSF